MSTLIGILVLGATISGGNWEVTTRDTKDYSQNVVKYNGVMISPDNGSTDGAVAHTPTDYYGGLHLPAVLESVRSTISTQTRVITLGDGFRVSEFLSTNNSGYHVQQIWQPLTRAQELRPLPLLMNFDYKWARWASLDVSDNVLQVWNVTPPQATQNLTINFGNKIDKLVAYNDTDGLEVWMDYTLAEGGDWRFFGVLRPYDFKVYLVPSTWDRKPSNGPWTAGFDLTVKPLSNYCVDPAFAVPEPQTFVLALLALVSVIMRKNK